MPIIVTADVSTEEKLEQLVDEDILRFDRYFQSLGNDPLVKFEHAVIKSYLFWKTHGEPTSHTTPVHGETNGEPNAETTIG